MHLRFIRNTVLVIGACATCALAVIFITAFIRIDHTVAMPMITAIVWLPPLGALFCGALLGIKPNPPEFRSFLPPFPNGKLQR